MNQEQIGETMQHVANAIFPLIKSQVEETVMLHITKLREQDLLLDKSQVQDVVVNMPIDEERMKRQVEDVVADMPIDEERMKRLIGEHCEGYPDEGRVLELMEAYDFSDNIREEIEEHDFSDQVGSEVSNYMDDIDFSEAVADQIDGMRMFDIIHETEARNFVNGLLEDKLKDEVGLLYTIGKALVDICGEKEAKVAGE